MIVDAHTHVWPDAIAERAIGAPSEDLHPIGDGKVAGLIEALHVAGVQHAVCLGIANTPRHLDATNRFAGSLQDPLIGLGSIHPGLDVGTNLDSLRSNGLRGAKINPPFQGYALDDPVLWEILDAMQGEYVLVTHVGMGGAPGTEATCTPQLVRDLARRFPRLDIVAAHLGGYLLEQGEREPVVGEHLYIDTSWPPSIAHLDPGAVRAVIERHGPERVLFGSDWPMGDPAEAIDAVRRLGLDDETEQGVLGANAARLFGLAV